MAVAVAIGKEILPGGRDFPLLAHSAPGSGGEELVSVGSLHLKKCAWHHGQAQFPASWRKQAGLMRGGPCDVRVLDDGRQSLLITPRPQQRRGAVGLLAHLEGQTVAFPKVKRHTMPFKSCA